MDSQKAEPLLGMLIDANKRASAVLDSAQRLSAKLVGACPSETSSMPIGEVSVAALTMQLHRLLADLEHEVERQHGALGEANRHEPMLAGQNRSVVGY